MATAGVDFFRVDRSKPTKRLLIVAGTLVCLGMTAIGAHLVSRLDADLAHFVTLVGGLAVAVGLILGFGGMAMFLFENVYLLIRDDGVLCHINGNETTIPWGELAEAKIDGAVVVFERPGRDQVRWFAGKDAKVVQMRVEEARRKAAHGLLKTES